MDWWFFLPEYFYDSLGIGLVFMSMQTLRVISHYPMTSPVDYNAVKEESASHPTLIFACQNEVPQVVRSTLLQLLSVGGPSG